ncbi:hypothetical protein D9757_013270 [Collybiopsis confluens]|uniref:Uncharacterized protein n=1 Tax=Collybiopsis confluens TaxID=2823264 RepID=A0A8H5D1W6_9AGAR|nr:hypothetical protein D9757_013270 [Collybiopsis confluens]
MLNGHSIRAVPAAHGTSPVIKVQFTSKTTTDAHALEALNAEVYIRQLLGRQHVKNTLGSDEIEFTNHNGESKIAEFKITGPAKCPCDGEVNMESKEAWIQSEDGVLDF